MAKTLVICCDGTGNRPDQKGGPTNVTKLARAILPETPRGRTQIVHYDEGVGTGNWWDRWLGGAFGIGLGANVQQAYRFLALNYVPGDRLVLIGFSRGAFTVRSLAGLVGLVGLLRKGDLDKMPDIWAYYRTPPEDRDPTAIDPDWICHRPDIDLLIVWDTVGSLGIPGNWLRAIGRSQYAFHDVKISKKVKRAYQALAVDEFRKPFAPAIWETREGLAPGQIVEQRWFAGAHCNVGGGYRNAVLSDAALRWVRDKVADLVALDDDFFDRRVGQINQQTPGGIIFDERRHIYRLFPRHRRPIGVDPSESVDDSVFWRRDARQPYHFRPSPYAPHNVADYFERLNQASNPVENQAAE